MTTPIALGCIKYCEILENVFSFAEDKSLITKSDPSLLISPFLSFKYTIISLPCSANWKLFTDGIFCIVFVANSTMTKLSLGISSAFFLSILAFLVSTKLGFILATRYSPFSVKTAWVALAILNSLPVFTFLMMKVPSPS